MIRKQEKFTWWMPKGLPRLTLYGAPKTRIQWAFGTFRSYVAYWRMTIAIIKSLCDFMKETTRKE